MSDLPLSCPELSILPALEGPLEEAGLESLLVLPFHPLRVEKVFHPAQVRLGWGKGHLVVLASLEDRDMYSTSTGPNQSFWLMGDVFEIFLQVDGHPDYLELHVTPNGHPLQLRFPSEAAMRVDRVAGKSPLEKNTLEGKIFDFRVSHRTGGWDVRALIPFETIRPGYDPAKEPTLRVSFSRYDCSRDTEAIDLSSTTPHGDPDFHRLFEWKRVTLTPRTSGE
jgi:hypothetical protein